MRKFVVTRIVFLAVTLLFIMTVNFALFRLMPGDPTLMIYGENMSREDQERVREAWGLNDPIQLQYVRYLGNSLTFQLGTSFLGRRSVREIVAEKLLNSLILIGPALVLAIVLGAIGGAYVGWKRGSRLERLSIIPALFLRSTPAFFSGIMILMVFAYQLRIFPSGGMMEPGTNLNALQALFTPGFWVRLPLPLLTTTLFLIGGPFMLMRTSILEVKGEDFMEVHKAKGLSESGQIRRAVRNASLPMITYAALMASYVMHGQVIIETIFAWPGVGRLLVQSILDQDYPVAQGGFFVMAFSVLIMNFLADLAYGFFDPRVTYK